MALSRENKSPLRKTQEGLVKAFFPELVEHSEEFEEGVSQSTHDFNGVIYPNISFPRDAIEQVKTFKPRKGDVMIVTCPRSGTHWAQAIAVMVRNLDNLAEVCKPEFMRSQRQMLGKKSLDGTYEMDVVSKWKGNRVFVTHQYPEQCDFPQLMRSTPEFKVIYVVRELKDVLTSWYHFFLDIYFKNKSFITFDEFFLLFKQKQLFHGDWFDHVSRWLQVGQQFPEQFLILRYEDMHADHAGTVRKVVKFCEVEVDEQQVQEIVQHSTFKAMKNIMNYANWAQRPSPQGTVEGNVELFARKGIIGDWESTFTKDALAYFEENLKNREPYATLYGGEK